MSAGHVLVVDDEPEIRNLVQEILEDEGYEVNVAEDAREARAQRHTLRPDLILLDIWMPGVDGITLLKEWRDAGLLNCPVIVMSGHGTIETAIESTKLGAWGFIEKPLSLSKLLATVKDALAENAGLSGGSAEPIAAAANLVGSHPIIGALRESLQKLAQHDATLLLIGEPGTGKETAARYLHSQGLRKQGNFVAFDPIPLSAESAAIRLFGEPGQAQHSMDSLFNQARGGTLFLNEVAEMERQTLNHLLNQLARLEFTRQPGVDRTKASPRLICATHYDLRPGGSSGGAFQELYLRLGAIPAVIPPLRDYVQDMPELLAYYVDYWCVREHCAYRHFSIAAQNRLRQHSWPGNLAELRNLVKRALLNGQEGAVELEEVEYALSESEFAGQSCAPTDKLMDLPLREAREAFERGYLLYQLQRADGSVSKLAQQVGMERTHLYRKLRALKIDIKENT